MNTLNFTPLAVPAIHQVSLADFSCLYPPVEYTQVIYNTEAAALASPEYVERVVSHLARTGNNDHHTIVCPAACGGFIVSYL